MMDIHDSDGGWPDQAEVLKENVICDMGDDTCILFRSLCRSFHIRLETIHFVNGDRDRHPNFP